MEGSWRHLDEPQVANAHRWFVNLQPVSEAPAAQTRNNWLAVLPGQTVPLIWEKRNA